MKKITATIQDIIDRLEQLKKSHGNIKVYVVANGLDESLPGTQIQFWGLSDTIQIGMEASTDTKFILMFRSDETLGV